MRNFSRLQILVIILICLNYSVKNQWKGWGGENWKTNICGDGYGYYAYLPCVFILHKFDYKKIIEEEKAIHPGIEDGLYALPLTTTGKECDKYFVGTAILMAPFFGIAYLLSYLTGHELNGYSVFFQYSIGIAALFYLFVGLYYLRKLLLEYNISDSIICFTLLAIVFGTNLFYYTTMGPSMSHTYSFSLMAVFLYYAKRSLTNFNLKNVLITAIVMSLLIIIRPTNILSIALLPFLAGNFENLKSFLKQLFNQKKVLLVSLLAAICILSIQFSLWYAQTGHLFVWSYSGEGFDFGKPHFFSILFSYTNGWILYTPLIFISLFGLMVLFKENFFSFSSFFIFTSLIIYVLSSWWAWTYGGFGLRAFIDFYPAFALLLALLIAKSKPLWKNILIISAVTLTIFLNLIQTYQFRTYILSFGSMTKELYWKIFLKTDDSYRGICDVQAISFTPGYSFTNNFEHNTWGNSNNITTTIAHNGINSAFVDSSHQFGPTFKISVDTLGKIEKPCIAVQLWAYMKNFDNNAAIVVSIQGEDKQEYFWKSFAIKYSVDGTDKWHEVNAHWELPAFKNPGDILSVYVWTTKGVVYIDDMNIKFGSLNK